MKLIEDATELKKHNSAISSSIELVGVQSYIDMGIDKFIRPAIGRSTFDLLVNNRTALPDAHRPAFEFIQRAAVGFMMAYYSVSGAVQINAGGISVIKGTNSAPASDKKLLGLRKDGFESGFGSLELAIDYIEENIASFAAYATSAEHKRNRGLLLNSAAEFQQAGVDIGGSAYLYRKIRTYQADAERTYIYPVLGAEMISVIKGVLLNGGATDKQKDLITEIQIPLASMTMKSALPFLPITIDGTGAYQLSESVGGMAANVETKNPVSQAILYNAAYQLQTNGERQVETLRKWLIENKAEFPAYSVPTEVNINSDPNSNMYFL